MELKSELEVFLKELKDYREILTNPQSKMLNSFVPEKKKPLSFLVEYLPKKTDEELKEEIIEERREKLVLKRGALKDKIAELNGRTDINQISKTWNRALNSNIGIGENKDALSFCIDYTIEAIGKLQKQQEEQAEKLFSVFYDTSDIIRMTTQQQKKNQDTCIELFENMQFHQKVVEASKSCFDANNYREAILNAFISLIDYIKEISRLDLDGDDLMNNAFSFNYDKQLKKITKYPIVSINELKNITDRDEQQGFMYLCKGAAAFVRNPKAHKLIVQTNPLHTLEYLAFASILFKQLDGTIEPK